MWTFSQINDMTGFANGEKFRSQDEVLNYFTCRTMDDIFGNDIGLTPSELGEMAGEVLANKWHCEFGEGE